MKQLMRNKSGGATIIAVILIAASIGITLPASYWLQGFVAQLGYEKVKIKDVYATKSGGTFTVNLEYVNYGNAETSIIDVYLNGIPSSDYSPAATLGGSFSSLPSSCEVNVPKVGTISFAQGAQDESGYQLNSGMTLTVTIVSSSGKEHKCMVVLP